MSSISHLIIFFPRSCFAGFFLHQAEMFIYNLRHEEMMYDIAIEL